jgi:hypothetical protein
MKCLSTSILLAGALSMGVASQLSANPDLYTDAAGDINPGIATAGGTLDILSLEITNNASDIVFKLTGIGLVQQGISDGLSEGNIRAVSIVKSASRSKRLTIPFTDYLDARTNAAAPQEVLTPALENALSGLATTDVRGQRVHAAFEQAIDPAGLAKLESDLEQIDKIAALTSPSATLTLLSVVEDGTDLRRARLHHKGLMLLPAAL